jgi:hypothetical protein
LLLKAKYDYIFFIKNKIKPLMFNVLQIFNLAYWYLFF